MESQSTKEHKQESSNSINCGIITLSDSRSKKEDLSGDFLENEIKQRYNLTSRTIIKDEKNELINAIEGMIEEKLLNLRTAFIGKVMSMESDSVCSVQPLDKVKAYGKEAKSQSVISKVPILSHVRHYTLSEQTLSGSVSPVTHGGHVKIEPLRVGDIVLCVCAERDISSSVKGMSTTPPVGHHQVKDAIVVGLIGV